jgi:hypothetical protein
MPRLAAFEDTIEDAEVEYDLYEDRNGEWRATMKVSARGEDMIDVANVIAKALRNISTTSPEHNTKCVCLLCSEWKLHNSKERLAK